MTEQPEDFTVDGSADIDDVDAVMDVGAADQDSAVAEFLLDHPYGHRIEEIEDHDVLGIDAEVRQEIPDPALAADDDRPVASRREELSRLLKAEEFAERVRRSQE
ncbi:hypothetical protein [Nocardiopsis sp. FIRDI 009]|uniref:hypothetical protein n=1 Tax=Nocardiopsis sp. FIRDI 009 TaxID=714197 RepID=UPI000E28A264|nr:hypothetical protein [Nocardiopsis sp. FIRDI 009]